MSLKRLSITKIERSCGEVCALLRALAHPGRLKIMGHLLQGPRSVSELQKLCGLSQSQLSQFLSRMRAEGLVKCEREGKFQFYRAADPRLAKLILEIQNLFCQ